MFAKGGEGGEELALKVLEALEEPSDFKPIYDTEDTYYNKFEKIAKEIYGADGVDYLPAARKAIDEITHQSSHMYRKNTVLSF